jgi:hypothetical protein
MVAFSGQCAAGKYKYNMWEWVGFGGPSDPVIEFLQVQLCVILLFLTFLSPFSSYTWRCRNVWVSLHMLVAMMGGDGPVRFPKLTMIAGRSIPRPS